MSSDRLNIASQHHLDQIAALTTRVQELEARLEQAEGLLMRWRCRFPQSSLCSLTTTFLHPEQAEKEKKDERSNRRTVSL
jgi:hypothetical protein